MTDSFSQDTKNEISASKSKMKCCRGAELYGMMFSAAFFGCDRIAVDTGNPAVYLRYIKLLREFFRAKSLSDAMLSDIQDGDTVTSVLDAVGIDRASVPTHIDRGMIKCQFCGWSFVKGVFLSCGTITSPENSYHLEFLMRDEDSAAQFAAFLEELGTSPRITERGDRARGIYFKDSESIVDILGYIGANRAAFDILNVKIYKDIRNNANRVSNCELANIGKTVAASNGQMRAIEAIISSGRADELPGALRETLDLRMAFPDATLSELAGKHDPPITKSGVNHRLKKLTEFAKMCGE